MPTEQNNEIRDENSDRVWRLKLFLIFGPYVIALIPIILSVFLLVNFISMSHDVKETNEKLDGVILQQGDLSEEVYDIAQRQDVVDAQITKLADSIAVMQSQIISVHPGLVVERDADAWPKRVYLTFDDGPSSNTAEILDILKKYGVKATFFTVGKQTEESKELYRRIVDEGHTLGMHSYSHVYNEIYASRSSFEKDLDKISNVIEEATGEASYFYRFPGGSNNNIIGSRFNEFTSVLNDRGIYYFDWNVSTGDATNPSLPAEEIVENAVGGIEKYEEAIILMHDLGNKDTTVEALPIIIERLQSEGIPIEPITESTKPIQYH